jgi:hypothetical protein
VNRELVAFRVVLLVAGAALLSCGPYAGYSYYKSRDWQQSVTEWYDRMNGFYAECEKKRDDSCEMAKMANQNFDEFVEARNEASDDAVLFGALTWLVPLSAFFLFFAGRWAITGRIRPLWPSGVLVEKQ